MKNSYIIDSSFQLIRTNTLLTTNVKINVDSSMNLYLESFDTNKQLSDDKYKHYMITKDSFLEDKLASFYDELPSNIAFDVKKTNDKDVIYNTFENQFDDLYWSGVKKVEQNKFYTEEFEYFAPLYLKYKDLPNFFIILRVDDLGVFESNLFDYNISTTNKSNFRDEIIKKWKLVKHYDLTVKSDLGYWLDRNFISNERFTDESFEFDSSNTNFSRWYGIDYKSGSYTEKSQFITDKIWYEQPHYKLEEYVTEGYKRNNIIFPNILNLNYLYDDTPATPFQLKKYSLNRYFGFYVDMEKIDALTSYSQNDLVTGLTVRNNVFVEAGTFSGSKCPFFYDETEWDENKHYYIFAKGELFEVKRIKVQNGYSYNIISEFDIELSDISRDNEIDIEFIEGNNYSYKNLIKWRFNQLDLDRIITNYDVTNLYADLYLIEIDDKFHVLEYNKDDDEYLIRTDHGIRSNKNTLKYWIESEVSNSTTKVIEDVLNEEKPLVYNIYRVKFRDIKDFDYDRVDSGYGDFDFDKKNEYVETPEEKLYTIEYLDATETDVYKTYDSLSIYSGKIKIASSEYVSDDELYEVTKNGLTSIWDKNQSIVKWGYTGSISHADYPYKLNNNNKVGGLYNRTTNTHSTQPDIISKTNDYFYRLGTYISGNTDGTTFDFKYFDTQSLNIETDSFEDGEITQFDLDEYLKGDFDYFDYFFNNRRYIDENKNYVREQHYSVFNSGSKYNKSTTLFKGIKYEISHVTDVIKKDNGEIEKYLTDTRDFNQYKFCVIGNYTVSGYTGQTYNDLTNKLRDYPEGVKYSKNLGNDNIHVFLNDKYKNVLIIVNLTSVVSASTININNLSYYDKEVIYNGKDKSGNTITDINTTLTNSYYFIRELNNNLIDYYYIDSEGYTGHTLNDNNLNYNGNMKEIPSWEKNFSPFRINMLENNKLSIKKNSFNVAALRGPKTNIYDKYKTNFNESVYDESFVKEPLARIIEIDEKQLGPRGVGSETVTYEKNVFRYNGSYEPIFKNISLFEPTKNYVVDGSEFTQHSCGGEFLDTTSGSSSHPWIFGEYSLDLCDNIYSYCVIDLDSSAPATISSNILTITDFNFNIPNNSTIKGITLKIKKYGEVGPTSGQTVNYYSTITDNIVELVSSGVTISDNKAKTGVTLTSIPNQYYDGFWWNESFVSVYGDNNDLWNSTIDHNIINRDDFGVKIQINASRFDSYDIVNIAHIDCVCIEIAYTIDNVIPGIIYTSTIEKNVKFDTNIYNFGKIENLIFSKVNENENILKLKNTKEDISYYPMIDEYGYTYDERFIFKSNCDSDFYVRTKNELE